MSACRPVLLALALAALPTTACVTSIEPDVHVARAPSEDPEYSKALEQATQDRVVLKDFETRYHVTATYLSPAFRNAFAKRYERVYKNATPQLEEASAKAGFLVSLQTPDADRSDLANAQHWTVLLSTPQGPLKPVLIQRLNDKERWRAFFDSVTEWTTEYLVIFDAPSVDTASPALVEKSPMTLTFANADGQVNLAW